VSAEAGAVGAANMDDHDGMALPVEQAGELHPKLRALHKFWERKRGERPLPARKDLDVIDLWPWLGNLMLIEVQDRGVDYLYRVYGTILADYFSRDLTGRRTSSLTADVQAVVRQEYDQAINEARPIVVTRARSVQQKRIRASKLILPLGPSGGPVDHLLVGLYLANVA
jgi:hypothetical protein